MKPVVVTVLLLFASGAITAEIRDDAAAAHEHTAAMPLGLERLTWSMTADAAKSAFPHLRRVDKDRDPSVANLSMDRFPLDGCDFVLSLEFYQGELNAISLAAVHDAQACKDHIKADLSVKYGRGKETHMPDLGVYDVDWHQSTGNVRYQENKGFNPRYANGHLSVSFWRPHAYFRPIP